MQILSKRKIVEEIISSINAKISEKLSYDNEKCQKEIKYLLIEIKSQLLKLNHQNLEIIVKTMFIPSCLQGSSSWWHEEILSICETVCRENGLSGYCELYKIA